MKKKNKSWHFNITLRSERIKKKENYKDIFCSLMLLLPLSQKFFIEKVIVVEANLLRKTVIDFFKWWLCTKNKNCS